MDHEGREMSEKHEIACADTRYVVPSLAVDTASDRAEETGSFSQKNSQCEFFVKKKEHVPCCRRRIEPFIQTNTWVGTYHVTPTVEMKQ